MGQEDKTSLANRLREAYSPAVEALFARRVDPNRAPGASWGSFLEYLQSIPGCVIQGQMDMVNSRGGGQHAAQWFGVTDTGNTPVAYASGDPRPAGGSRTDVVATLPWGGIWATVAMAGDAYHEATPGAMNTNEDAWAGKMEEVTDDIIDKVDEYFCSDGSVTNAPSGIDAAIGSTSNTYAGINRSTTAEFRPASRDLSGDNLTTDDIDAMHIELTETRRKTYDRILCCPTVFRKVGSILQSRQRNPRDLAITDMMYGNKPIQEIPGLPSGKLFFVRDKHWRVPRMLWKNGVLNGSLQQSADIKGMPFGLMIGDDGSDGTLLTMAVKMQLVYKNPYEAAFIENIG